MSLPYSQNNIDRSFEYELHANPALISKNVKFKLLPELNIEILDYQNNLCPSHYSDAVCVWEGDLSATFLVNGQVVTVNDHDRQKGKFDTIGVNGFKYMFQGTNSYVKNKSKDETYLIFTVTKVPEKEVVVKTFYNY